MIEKRLSRLREFMLGHCVDGVILLRPENLRYFSGFTGGEGALFVTADTAELWTDSRYTEQAQQQSGSAYAVRNHQGRLFPCLGKSAMAQEVQVLAYEQDSLLHRDYEQFEQNSECAFEGVDVTPLRAQKDEAELDATRRASIIADQAFAQVLPYIRPGVTERDISSRLESAMLLLGSEEKSFYTIVASGVRSSMPHGAASSKIIEKGDFITFDFGAVCDGYHSDMTRTIVVGKASREQRDFYSLVLEAQELGVASIRAGVSCREVDRLVRNFFSSRYVNQYFTHALGHGTGLEVHEAPILALRATGPLKENMIVTVEPGLYIEGKYGVRIEDSVAVTAAGCEILTKTSKELMELS